MANKTEKTINLLRVNEIIEFSNELLARGETLKSIKYKGDFKFDKGSLFLGCFLTQVKSFVVSIEESNRTIERTYKPIDDDNPYSIDDFQIDFEYTFYKD